MPHPQQQQQHSFQSKGRRLSNTSNASQSSLRERDGEAETTQSKSQAPLHLPVQQGTAGYATSRNTSGSRGGHRQGRGGSAAGRGLSSRPSRSHQSHYTTASYPVAAAPGSYGAPNTVPMGISASVYGNLIPHHPMSIPSATVTSMPSASTSSTSQHRTMAGSVAAPQLASEPVDPATADALKPYILGQVEYYFSVDNLVRDAYFRRQMDGDGWIPLAVLARFPRIRALATDVHLLRDALLSSNVVEVETDGLRVRKRDGWAVWVFPEDQRMAQPA